MSYKIIMDSCGEIPERYAGDKRFTSVPLEIEVGGYRIVDDATIDREDLIRRIAESKTCPKSSCPSPDSYMDAYRVAEEDVYVITLSGKLSGSYNSACLGRDLFHEEVDEEKNIFVIDSQSAAGGETQIAMKIMELCEQGLAFEEVCEELTRFRDSMNTYFVLDNLDTLRKNGRLTGVKSLVASTLNIKPVMGADTGEIIQLSQAIGVKKALKKMVDILVKECTEPEKKRIVINQVHARDRAEYVKELVQEALPTIREVMILDTSGISTMYANEGGVIVTI